ncbi:MAG: plasma-membrane proton-efflux P-type ATPase [Patescibacteria group bacterium]|nr:plasma-membrane proton-efflux P-type ATPase [Patescibacteria group bacterium]MDE1945711.1 plasma-membrane proton-efflux P-type ATPase [Patescibacteria group bacterium]
MQGLTAAQAKENLKRFGPNEIAEKKRSALLKFLSWLVSPIALMLFAAAFLSLAAGNVFDFYFILVLALLNFFVSFWQERKADDAVKKLEKKLSVEVKTLRDGAWAWIPAGDLVPDDAIRLDVGAIVPADAAIVEGENVTANESQLTGESLPKEKHLGDPLYSGSFITTGFAVARVTATGARTNFGKTMTLVENVRRRSLLEEDILRISKFLSVLSLIAVIILSAILIGQHAPFLEVLTLDLALVIAGIPISLPTVMSLIIGFGVLELSKRETIVRRLSALENLANVNLLLSDKTGTLTKNAITVEKIIRYDDRHSDADLLRLALATASQEKNPLNQAIVGKCNELGIRNDRSVVRIIPGDSERKRSTAVLTDERGARSCVTVGAVETVLGLSGAAAPFAADVRHDADESAKNGYRSLAVAEAAGDKEERMQFLGLILLSDSLFDDAPNVVQFLKENGIGVKILTGDSVAVSERIANKLGLPDGVVSKKDLDAADLSVIGAPWWGDKDVFAEILPEDKLKLVEAAKRDFEVAVTGDGVNDLPAIKIADVGIAVSNAVDALKSAADIVLLTPGIAVIETAIIEARKIFARLYSYSVYRISESLRLIVTIAVLGVIYGAYPLTPVELILIAFLNDLPIISLAFNRVAAANSPSSINVARRFTLSSLFGLIGVVNSLLMFFLATSVFHLPLPVVETLFFLKLTIGGHMLIYVAHTEKPWWRFLPSRPVILATTITQILATLCALFGWFMAAAPLFWVAVIWVWAFFWMQVSEGVKLSYARKSAA